MNPSFGFVEDATKQNEASRCAQSAKSSSLSWTSWSQSHMWATHWTLFTVRIFRFRSPFSADFGVVVPDLLTLCVNNSLNSGEPDSEAAAPADSMGRVQHHTALHGEWKMPQDRIFCSSSAMFALEMSLSVMFPVCKSSRLFRGFYIYQETGAGCGNENRIRDSQPFP